LPVSTRITPTVSIIVPCHNETDNLQPLHQELSRVLAGLTERFELIFVDDGSSDDTAEALEALAERDSRVRVVQLVRNFGKEIATTVGLHQAKGDAAICLDADLQHPPALIPALLQKWREGAEVVVGVRESGHGHTSVFKQAAGGLFYRLMNAMSEVRIVAHATDYRLLDRSVINEFNRFTERTRITRGLIDWLGFRSTYISFTPAKRHAGEAAYSYLKLIRLAMDSFISMSLVPLRLAGYLGMFITLGSGLLGVFIFTEKYIMRDPWHFNFSGPAILAVIVLFLVGIVLVSLGLMSLYIASIHIEVMNRPLYVVRSRPARRVDGEIETIRQPRRLRERVRI
jgi:glycosyltransferase involved in cell wall biosynthesis